MVTLMKLTAGGGCKIFNEKKMALKKIGEET